MNKELYFGFVVGLVLGMSIILSLTIISLDITPQKVLGLDYGKSSGNYDRISEVGCDSDSMGLTMDCGDQVYLKYITVSDRLRPGSIYVYEDGNTSVVHRLVICVDTDCNMTVFKGDNNYIAELVDRRNITGIVTRVEYK